MTPEERETERAEEAALSAEWQRECRERIEVMPGDITDASHRQALAERLASRGRLDVLASKNTLTTPGRSPHGRAETSPARSTRPARPS